MPARGACAIFICMILTCPNCATRYQADAAKFQPAGRNVRCAKCGHVWHQDPPASEPEAIRDVVAPPEPVPATAPPPPAVAAPPSPPPEVIPPAPRPAAFAPNPVIAREPAVAPPVAVPKPAREGGPSQWPRRIALAAGWLGLIAIVLLIGWSAMTFREQIAVVWPQSASVYAALGMKTNTSGIDIRGAEIKRRDENGQPVLAVSGQLANTSSRELPVPQIRVALIDDERRELYHWMIVPGTMTLRPGQTTTFTGRLTNPPQGFSHFELRFARDGE